MKLKGKATIAGVLVTLIALVIIIALLMRNQKVWNERPFSTDKESIEWVLIEYGYTNYEVPEDMMDEFLTIFSNMKFKKRKIETDQIGGVLSPDPATVYHITIHYKHGGSAKFTIIPEADCITIADDGVYYYKHYDEKAMNELFGKLNN